MKIYTYIGDGAGIPGLPHEITEDQVKVLSAGEAKQFKSALDAGLYAESVGKGEPPAPRIETTFSRSKSKKADDVTAEGD